MISRYVLFVENQTFDLSNKQMHKQNVEKMATDMLKIGEMELKTKMMKILDL